MKCQDRLYNQLSSHLGQIALARRHTLESTDPEGLHDLRVAMRGLRVVLSILGKQAAELRTQWRIMANATGPTRDLEVLLALIDTLLQAGRAAEARQAIDQALQRYGDDPLLWRLAARSYGEADPLRYHAALGNAFFFEQKFDSARLQYQLASRAKGDDFYLRSAIEARLRELDAQRQSAP